MFLVYFLSSMHSRDKKKIQWKTLVHIYVQLSTLQALTFVFKTLHLKTLPSFALMLMHVSALWRALGCNFVTCEAKLSSY